jgi:hypothetical protein
VTGSQIETPPIPTIVSDSPQERAEAGRQMAALIASPGFKVLKEAIRAHQGQLTAMLMARPAASDGAVYADVVGQLKGIAAIEPIARGVVQEGEAAEAEIRSAEEGEF